MCFWAKARLTNIPVAPESRRAEVEMECREVVVWSSTLMLRAWVDLDRMYMNGGVTAGGGGDTDSCFSLGVSLLSGVPRIGCDLVGYLQQECFLLSNWGTPLAGCGSKNPVTPLPHFSWAQCCPLSSHGITSNSNSYSFHDCLDGLQRQGVCVAHSMHMGFWTVLGDVPWLVTVVTGLRWVLGLCTIQVHGLQVHSRLAAGGRGHE